MRVVFSSPLVVIDSVKNSREDIAPVPEKTIQACAEVLSHDFARVTRADSGNRIGISNAGFQTIHLAVELDARWIEVIPRQIHQRIMAGGENSLIREVMNR